MITPNEILTGAGWNISAVLMPDGTKMVTAYKEGESVHYKIQIKNKGKQSQKILNFEEVKNG